MPMPKRPRVASLDEVKITRDEDGETAIIEYADPTIVTTSFRIGKGLAVMADAEVLELWNDGLEATAELMRTKQLPTIEIPVGKPQLEYFAAGDQWVPRGDVIRCVIVNDSPSGMDDDFISVDERDFTVREFVRMVGTFGGWGMRMEFVDREETHIRPDVEVREPEDDSGSR